MTEEQLRQLMTGLIAALPGAGGGGGGGTATVLGQMPACDLGKDKVRRVKKFQDWRSDAEAKMKVLGITQSQKKVDFVRSCAGAELLEFWRKEARI